MDFVKNIIKMTMHRIKNTPFTTLFLISGLALAMLIISISVSFVSELMVAISEKDRAKPPNGEQYCILWSDDDVKENIDIQVIFGGISQGTGMIFNGLMVHIDEEEINTYASVSGELFFDNDTWHYPLIEGRYYTAEEIEKGEKVVLIGKNYQKYIYKENGAEYIDIETEKYEVLGIVGLGEQASLWDARVFMPYTSIPQRLMSESMNGGGIGFIIYSNTQEKLKEDIKRIRNNVSVLGDESEMMYVGEIDIEDITGALASDLIIVIAILGYIATMIYAINIMIYWMEKRKKEIATRKAIGYKDRDIVKLLLAEMVGISGLAFVLAMVIQGVLGVFMDSIAGYNLQIYVYNIVVGIIVISLTAIITSALPVWKMLKVQPIDALRKG